ncbi:MAG: spore protease YyaC [Syntrophomonadaceae bacterium]|nr:spore protease YyaC [Syntrophomonadaceae bacterium]
MLGISQLIRTVFKEEAVSERIRAHYQEPFLIDKLSSSLCRIIHCLDRTGGRPLVVVGIGTDRSTGDCLGPLVGTKLRALNLHNIWIYGHLDEPVHAGNLQDKLQMINTVHSDPLVIAVDACLGQSESVGSLTLAPGPIKPGAGVNKTLPLVGEIHFTGIVNVGGFMEYFVLQNTRLSLVMKMADVIAQSIAAGVFSLSETRIRIKGFPLSCQ